MGRGGDGRLVTLRRRVGSVSNLAKEVADILPGLKNDMTVLRHMWFSKAWKSGSVDHASRLESFYGPQATACEFDAPIADQH
jgi:hypothetical protein